MNEQKLTAVSKAGVLSKTLKKENKHIVLVGGCFDLLHPGHLAFLKKAKRVGDILIVLLESDEKIRKLKGSKRPIQNQKQRAETLSKLKEVDYVVALPFMKEEWEYDDLIGKIKPDIIAISAKDKDIHHHKRAAKLIGAKLKCVTKIIGNYSTTNI